MELRSRIMYSLNLIEAREVISAHYTGEKESLNAEEVKQYDMYLCIRYLVNYG